MAALSEELANLLNPTPNFKDPEDYSDDDTRAKVADFGDELELEQTSASELRKKNLNILGDFDKKYAGKKTSRKDLEVIDHVFPNDDTEDEIDDDSVVENDANSDGSDEDDDQNYDKTIDDDQTSDLESSSEKNSEDENITDFQNKMKRQSSEKEFSFQDDGDYGKYGDDASEGESDLGLEGSVSDLESDEEGDDGKGVDSDDDEEITSEEEAGIQKFSTAGGDEVAKGKAAKQQLGLWDSLLEGRIKLQKAVSIINQLPQPDSWTGFEEKAHHFTEESAKTQNVLKHILDSLVHLQDILLYQNTETKHLTGDGSKNKGSSSKQQAPGDSDDEEIPSDSDEELAANNADDNPEVKVAKRKLKMEDYPGFLAKRHTEFQEYRDVTIQRWNDKTQLSGGKIKGKSFNAFEQSALKQINQILGDRKRLIKRTQLKRSQYKVLGKSVDSEQLSVSGEETVADSNPMNQDHLKDYDSEIFDDSDFYHQMLRELIEKKTSDINDPVALSSSPCDLFHGLWQLLKACTPNLPSPHFCISQLTNPLLNEAICHPMLHILLMGTAILQRQWLEIQKLRGKTKKKVDNRASKGRKVRYDVHSKLVNFMAPMNSSDWSDEARDDLFKSLFGKRFNSAAR